MTFAGEGGAVMCHQCYEGHLIGLAYMSKQLSVAIPKECNVCGHQPNPDAEGNIRLWMHLKDGIYQFLCKLCSDAYERKRLDLYGDTRYGWIKKLKGAK